MALAGCRVEDASGGDRNHQEEHTAHVIPAHKPKDFPEAVRRLRTLNGRIERKVAEGRAASLVADETLPVALDIAQWLPEIAADSDMSEEAWDRANARSATMVASYRALLAGASRSERFPGAPAAVKDADRALSDLEGVLAHADPRWFAGRDAARRPDRSDQ